jgi:hypothetical protein
MKKRLVELAHARSGDKGNIANIALFAPDRATYDLLAREVTPQRVRAHFDGLITGTVERYEAPNILALNFVLRDALGGGASRSLRSDALGKSMSSALLRMEIDM